MNNKCNLIRDILPLYVEDMVSTDTREFVSKHLEHCEACRAEFEHMRKPADIIPDADIVPLKRIKKELFIKRLQTVFLTAILACAIVTVLFGILTSPKFFPYSDDLFNVNSGVDGSITIAFDNKVTGYSCMKEFNDETKTEIYQINAWTTTWDIYSSNRGKQNMVIPSDRETNIQIFYAQNDGSEDVLIYGTNDNAYQDTVTLPRQIFLPYFMLAFLVLVILAVLRFLLKNKQATIVWIDRAILFPPKIPKSIIHMLAHIQFKEFHDFFLKRCHCCINLLALPFNSNHPQGFHFIYDFLHIMAFKPSRLVHDVFDL